MSRPRIHRNELENRVLDSVTSFTSTVAFYHDKREEGKAIYNWRNQLSNAVITDLLRDYAVVRKHKTERVV